MNANELLAWAKAQPEAPTMQTRKRWADLIPAYNALRDQGYTRRSAVNLISKRLGESDSNRIKIYNASGYWESKRK